MKAAFVVNNRNKGPHVYKAVAGALAQTYPCDIIISDQGSMDQSVAEIERAILECPRGAEHEVRFLRCPIEGPPSMRMANAHMLWCFAQTDAPWIFQCSSDDRSLPERVAACMEAVEANPCSVVGTTMFFENPESGIYGQSGFPEGYVAAGDALSKLVYGSCIAGYSREFLQKVGDPGANTIDVLWGFLGALDKGYYVVNKPLHVHCEHASADNAGYGGKLRAAKGDESLRCNELNHAQLFRLYASCMNQAPVIRPEIPGEAWQAVCNMAMGQAFAWWQAREKLSEAGVTPGTL